MLAASCCISVDCVSKVVLADAISKLSTRAAIVATMPITDFTTSLESASKCSSGNLIRKMMPTVAVIQQQATTMTERTSEFNFYLRSQDKLWAVADHVSIRAVALCESSRIRRTRSSPKALASSPYAKYGTRINNTTTLVANICSNDPPKNVERNAIDVRARKYPTTNCKTTERKR